MTASTPLSDCVAELHWLSTGDECYVLAPYVKAVNARAGAGAFIEMRTSKHGVHVREDVETVREILRAKGWKGETL